MKNNIAGMVILYFPDINELTRNMESYLPYVDTLVVVDNTGRPIKGVADGLSQINKVQYIANEENMGVAAALNQGAKLAIEQGYEWLLTMDQDSFFEERQAKLYFSIFNTELAGQAKLALVAPTHYTPKPGIEKDTYSDKISVMTSGNLLRLSAWKTVYGFDEKLFIDEVDHDYCYRLKKETFRIVQINHALIDHQLGTLTAAGYLGFIARKKRRIHSPLRVYFMVRNYLYVRREYGKLFPEEFKERNKALRVTIKNNLFFSGKFMENLRSIRKACRDYKAGKFPIKP